MKYLSTDEYITNINNLIKTQNRRIKKRLDFEVDERNFSAKKVSEIMQKFDLINKYVRDEIMTSLNSIKGNDRYIFSYFDDSLNKSEPSYRHTAFDAVSPKLQGIADQVRNDSSKSNAKYFKIIIKNKVTNMENFIIVTYDMREFFVKIKPPNSENEVELLEENFKLARFSKAKFRSIFFEYLISILELDTMPRFKPPIDFTVEVEEKPMDIATEIKILELKIEKATSEVAKLNSKNK